MLFYYIQNKLLCDIYFIIFLLSIKRPDIRIKNYFISCLCTYFDIIQFVIKRIHNLKTIYIIFIIGILLHILGEKFKIHSSFCEKRCV
jgi:hypothetical protein